MSAYVELHCHSNFSFLDGASHPEAMARRAAELGMPALAITDHDGLHGAVRFYNACKEVGVKPIIGTELSLELGYHLTLLARDMTGYSNLCRLITRAQLDHDKTSPTTDISFLDKYSDGIICLSGCRQGEIRSLIARNRMDDAYRAAEKYIRIFGRENFWIELQDNLYPEDRYVNRSLVELAQSLGVGYVATNNVHYAHREGHKLHDVLTSIRERTTLDECRSLRLNSEFYLKSPDEMVALFEDYTEAISNTLFIGEQCNLQLEFSAYRFPDFPLPEGETANGYLATLCRERASDKYGDSASEIEGQLDYELGLISRLDLSGYFLVVWDIMEYARRNGIPAQGRGSAANSLVAYILGITKVDPIENGLFMGRFLNEEMSSVPDIDIDISTNHREKVIQYVYRKYGEEHTAMVCTYVTFQARNAIREVGKALGLPSHILDRMARLVSSYGAEQIDQDIGKLEEFKRYLGSGLWQEFTSLCRSIADFPRHVSIHVGGMLISSCPLTDLVPLQKSTMPGRVVCQWDKDGVADAGLIKIDLLGLRMLSLVHEATELVEQSRGKKIDMDGLPADDPEVYDMICAGDTIGVFQVESRAQMQTLPQTNPRSIKDLTIEVAIVRPGPIQGNMIHPYIRRRKGLEEIDYPHPRMEPILRDTLGIILFQEQVIQVAMAIASFTSGEADSLRRAMSRKRSNEAMEQTRDRFMRGAEENGVDKKTADQVFETLKGFAEYGFCKSHAAGFALLSYQSAWLKRYYPAEFCAALLNNQPMGFYTPDIIVNDTRRHGVSILSPDINRSGIRCTVEGSKVRLGFMYVKGVGEKAATRILKERQKRPFTSLEDFYSRVRLDREALENLIMVGAFDWLGLPRRQVIWDLIILEKTGQGQLPLRFQDSKVSLPDMTEAEEVKTDYEIQGLSTRHHPVEVIRKSISRDGIVSASGVHAMPSGSKVRFAGYVATRQRPVTARGFAFLSLEDEEGMVNVVVNPFVYENYRQTFRMEPLIVVEGTVQRREENLNIVAEQLLSLEEEKRVQQTEASAIAEPHRGC